MSQLTKSPRLVLVALGWTALLGFGLFFIWRDVGKHFFVSDHFLGMTPNAPLIVHITTSTVAYLLGPLQFWPPIRRRWPEWHRRLGWAYVSCSLVSVPSMYLLGIRSFCSMCTPPFLLWTTIFVGMTLGAVVSARNGNFRAHRQFMIRSYVLMNGFVFTRLDDFFPFPLPTGEGIDRNSMIIWLVWVVPLLCTELWLNWIPTAQRRRRQTI